VIFEGARDYDGPVRRWPVALLILAIGMVVGGAIAWSAGGPKTPSGQPVTNQALSAGTGVWTPSDSLNLPAFTRGIHVGDVSACSVAVIFQADSAAVTMASVQPGFDYAWSIWRIMATNTTCTAITPLY
jgi:hypothetical protein